MATEIMKNWPKSRTYAWSAGAGSVPVELNFLDRSLDKYNFPMIDTLWARVVANIDVGAAGAPSRLFPQLCRLINVEDVQGLAFKISGAGWRAVMQQEYGASYSDGRNLAVGAGQDIEIWLRVPFTPKKAARGYDFGCPVLALRGGQIEWNWFNGTTLGIANQITAVNSAAVTFYAEVREARKGVIPARMKVEEMKITESEFAYPIDGNLRFLLAYVGVVAENNGTAWGTQTIDSDTLALASFPSTFFRENYFLNSDPRVRDPSVTGTTEDMVVNDFIVPVYTLRRLQKMTELPLLKTFHYLTDATITLANVPTMIKSLATKRGEEWAVASTRAASYAAVDADLQSAGVIKRDDGGRPKIGSWKTGLVDIMPITFKKGA